MIKIASKKSVNYDTGNKVTLRKKCPCLEFLWFVFSRIRNEYGPEKLRIRTFFTQWPFFKGTAKIKRWSFQGRNFISLETVEGMFTLVIIEAWRHVFVSYRETLNLLLKKSITTTDEPPRGSNFINSINIHNNRNKSSALNITNDDRDDNSNSVTETNRIETNKSESSNGDSNSNKSVRWDGNANKNAQSKNFSKKSQTKTKIFIYLATVW